MIESVSADDEVRFMKKLTMAAALNVALGLPALTFGSGYEFAPIDPFLVYTPENRVGVLLNNYSYKFEGDYPASLGGGQTGEVFQDASMVQLSAHHEVDDHWSLSFQSFKPYDLRTSYSSGAYSGSSAQFQTTEALAILKYQFDDTWSVFGGPAVARTKVGATMNQVLTGGFGEVRVSSNPDIGWGYVAGGSFEIKDIGFRATLTYESEISHTFNVTESGSLVSAATMGATDSVDSRSKTRLPESITLDLFTGITPSTLAFFTVHHRKWSEHKMSTAVVGEIASFPDDGTTFRLGIINQTTPNLITFGTLMYEDAIGGPYNPLAPNDGYRGVLAGFQYDFGAPSIGLALEYGETDDVEDAAGTRFENNQVFGVNVSLEYAY